MKSQDEIERRLRTLRVRYTKKHIAASQERLPQNCIYNLEQAPNGHYTKSKSADVDIAPRHSITLVVIQPESPIRLCMYGADDPSKWPGNICDKAETARCCSWFSAKVSKEVAKTEFLNRLADDEYVYENHPDIAALQWATDGRVYKKSLSPLERLRIWLFSFFVRVPPALPQLPEGEVPDDLWDDE